MKQSNDVNILVRSITLLFHISCSDEQASSIVLFGDVTVRYCLLKRMFDVQKDKISLSKRQYKNYKYVCNR